MIVSAVLVVAVVALIVVRRRRRKGRYVQCTQKHPTGFVKYHEHTETMQKSALEPVKSSEPAKSVGVLRFKGDVRASTRHSMSRCIDEILLNQEKLSEVVLVVESPGGSVTDYGHVYAEIQRLRASGLKITACVDAVAASGGYLICLPANEIIAAPFSMVGSIGVVSFIPNIRKLLEKNNVEPRTFTAGDFKRTVTLTDDATPEQVDRYKQQLELIHDQFKDALKQNRPQVELAKVATGEAWLAKTTVEKNLGLVDRLGTSAAYLLEKNKVQALVEFREEIPQGRLKWISRLRGFVLELVRDAWANEASDPSYGIHL